jgi:nucleoside-diphosphate-sugar epimerase
LDGKLPLIPRSSFAVVDVRDVADLHVKAVGSPRAAGEREAPDWLIRVAARFVPKLDPFVATLGELKLISTAKATNVLGWQPRPTPTPWPTPARVC